ncbi:MAG: polysaccharide biosynthesis/export family protein [Lachnospiraceae bacterium]|nr:polysaccharide biosynthesis/export family protein [Lachnospiraceae bacterium]
MGVAKNKLAFQALYDNKNEKRLKEINHNAIMKVLRLCAILGLVSILASCSSNKRSKFVYFQDIDTAPKTELPDYETSIKNGDELVITVNSTDPTATAIYNVPLANPASNSDLAGQSQPRQQTYIVDTDGNIQFPVLGDVHVAGLTLSQARKMLEEKISADVQDPIVKVGYDNYIINVAGEVKNPRQLYVNRPRFSVLDAISASGDLTPYGRRDNILVIREEEDGTRSSARLDMTKSDIFKSPYFYMQQNDYVYVEPTEVREDNAEYNQNNAFKLSVISTITGACSVVASLIIALLR